MHCRHAVARGARLFPRLQAKPVAICGSVRACSSSHSASMQKKHVVVVGAGFAGISAARTLLAESKVPIEVEIVEASGRVGGRACTTKIEGCGKVELGATWFHGIEGNPLYEHAVQLGLITRQEIENSKPTWGAVKYLRQREVSPLSEADAAVIIKARDLYGEAVQASTAAALSGQAGVVGDYVRQAYVKAMGSMRDASSRTKAIFTDAWAWREQLQRAMDGCHTTDDMSARSLAQYEEFEGPNIPLPSGYQALAEKLAEGLPIRYGTIVEQVHWGSTGVTVQCQGGEEFHADAVIMTVSLGVLKAQHQRMFKPQLPTTTVEAIERLGFGVVDKIFVDFGLASDTLHSMQQDFCSHGPAGSSNADQSRSAQENSTVAQDVDQPRQCDKTQPLPVKDALSYYLLWNHAPHEFQPTPSTDNKQKGKVLSQNSSRDPLSDIKGMSNNPETMRRNLQKVSSAAKGAGDKSIETHVITGPQQSDTKSQEGSTGEGVVVASTLDRQPSLPVWAKGAYTIRFSGSEFVQDMSEGAVNTAKFCGVVWITGEDAQDMESMSDAELHRNISCILQEFPALALPTEFKVYRSCWGSDPLFQGSYSYGSASAVGTECLILSQPLVAAAENTGKANSCSDLRILFAGEACHSKFFGCTHGAYLTGESQAKKLLQSWMNIIDA